MKTLLIALVLILLPSVCLAQMTEYERESIKLQRQALSNQNYAIIQQQWATDEANRLERQRITNDIVFGNDRHHGYNYPRTINQQAQAAAFDQMTNQPPIVNLYDDIAKQRAYDQLGR